MRKEIKTALISFVLGLCVFQFNAFSQDSDYLLNQRIEVNLLKTHLISVVNELSSKHKIPIGLELDKNYRQRDFEKMFIENNEVKWKDKIEIEAGTLEGILNSLIKQMPEYKWEVRDDVINIFPTKERDKFLQDILGVRVKIFSEKKPFSKSRLLDSINKNSKFENLFNEEKVKLKENNWMNQIYNFSDSFNQDFYVKDESLRSVLNKFIKENNNQKLWVAERTGKKKENLSISF